MNDSYINCGFFDMVLQCGALNTIVCLLFKVYSGCCL